MAVQVRAVCGHTAAPRAWVLALALAATVVCLPWPVSAADGASPSRHLFDIPAQPLDSALLEFSRQSGRQLVAVGSFGDDRRSRPLRGLMEERVALERLLAGTGLAFQLRDDGTVVVSAQAVAPSTAPATPSRVPAPRVVDLASVQVTARKRQESRIGLPLAVTSIDAFQIDEQRLHNVVDTVGMVPGASSVDTGGGFTQMQLRGVSSSLGGNDNGYYLDDVPFTGVTVPWYPDARAFDIERIEVLRGPQGTLFGEGAMGGTIRILTRKPVLDAFEARVRTSLSTTKGGGNGHGIKGMLNLPVVHDRLGLRLVWTDEQLPGWVDDPDTGRDDVNAQRIRTTRMRLRFSPDAHTDIDLNDWRWASVAPGGGYSALDGMRQDVLYGRDSSWASRSLVVERRFDAATLSYAGGSVRLDYLADGELAPGAPYQSASRIEVDTHELRLASAGERRLDWIAGVYQRSALRADQTHAWPSPPQVHDQRNRAWAAFGEMNLRLPAPGWSVTAGLRYFRDEVHAQSRAGDSDVRIDADFPAISPKFALSWTPSPQAMVYASVSSGFRSGQLQPAASIIAAREEGVELPHAIDPDEIMSYEIGARRSWRSGRLVVEGALFRGDWKDVAVRLPLTETVNGLLNSDGVAIRGLELAMAFSPRPGSSVQLAGSVVDAAYLQAIDGTPIASGDPVYNVPRTSLAGSWDYSMPLARNHLAGIHARLRYHSAREVSLTRGSPGDPILALDAGLSLAAPGGWSVSLYAENLLDEAGAVDARNLRGAATRLRPRTVGVEFEFDY